MNLSFITFRQAMEPFPAFSINDIRKHFPEFDTRRLNEWQKKGYIHKIRNKYYYFADKEISREFLWYLANLIYAPSYISLESALNYYGIIPESVFMTTSVSGRKTITFQSDIHTWQYRHLKPALFWGYRFITWNETSIKVAEPEKTLIDYLHLNTNVSDITHFKSLRWNKDVLTEEIDWKKLTRYEEAIGSVSLSKRMKQLYSWIHD